MCNVSSILFKPTDHSMNFGQIAQMSWAKVTDYFAQLSPPLAKSSVPREQGILISSGSIQTSV